MVGPSLHVKGLREMRLKGQLGMFIALGNGLFAGDFSFTHLYTPKQYISNALNAVYWAQVWPSKVFRS